MARGLSFSRNEVGPGDSKALRDETSPDPDGPGNKLGSDEEADGGAEQLLECHHSPTPRMPDSLFLAMTSLTHLNSCAVWFGILIWLWALASATMYWASVIDILFFSPLTWGKKHSFPCL